MRPSEAMAGRLDTVRAIIARYPVRNPRVFGSVARGEDEEGSDLDLLVEPLPTTTYFDLAALEEELAALLGIRVDVLTPGSVGPGIADSVRRDLRPL
jgi:predicted nucleotidyltransferase